MSNINNNSNNNNNNSKQPLDNNNNNNNNNNNANHNSNSSLNVNRPRSSDYVIIKASDLELHEKCGSGAFGYVYRATWTKENGEKQIVAVKKLLELQDHEAKMLSQLRHRNIIFFYGAVFEPPDFSLVTEYASEGSLQAYIKQYEIEWEWMLRWAKDIASGMNYLHEEAPHKIMHRDLKSTNVVVTQDLVCKICDFGTSTFNLRTTKMSVIGTFPWMSPEIIQGKLTNNKCDVWSYGVVLWELVTGEYPFKNLQSYQISYLVVTRGERLPIPTGCPKVLSDLMTSCWQTDPHSRPSFREILTILNNIKFEDETQIRDQLISNKSKWNSEIEAMFEKLSLMEQDLNLKEKILEERERQLRDQHLEFYKNFKIIALEDYEVRSWRDVDVYEWIKKISESDEELKLLAEVFLNNKIDGKTLMVLTETHLRSICSIQVPIGPQIRLLNEIEHLKQQNQRLTNFPPLKQPINFSQQSSTKEITYTACIGAHIIPDPDSDDYLWKIYFDSYFDSDENRDLNIQTLIRDIKFVLKSPIQQINLPKPFIMNKWNKGLSGNTKVDCIITYEDNVVNNRTTRLDYELNIQNNKNMYTNINLLIRDNKEQRFGTQMSASTSTSSLSPRPSSANLLNLTSQTVTQKNATKSWASVVKSNQATIAQNRLPYRAQYSENVVQRNSLVNNTLDKNYKRRNTFNTPGDRSNNTSACNSNTNSYPNSNRSSFSVIVTDTTANNNNNTNNNKNESNQNVSFDLYDGDCNSSVKSGCTVRSNTNSQNSSFSNSNYNNHYKRNNYHNQSQNHNKYKKK